MEIQISALIEIFQMVAFVSIGSRAMTPEFQSLSAPVSSERRAGSVRLCVSVGHHAAPAVFGYCAAT